MLSLATIRQPANAHLMVCMEVTSSHLRLAIVDTSGSADADDRTRVLLDETPWRIGASSLLTETGAAELREAFSLLVHRHDLRNARVHVSLGGELCVSRVASGELPYVTAELRGFESRCQRYLCLGHGHKAHASRIQPHHGRHHGMLTAANHQVVSAVEAAARESGVRLAGIEPSVTSVSRLMGLLDDDRDNPVLLVNLDGQGVEFSLCHEGRPLVQFRPAPGYKPEEAGDAAQSNMSRLRRNCQKYAGFQAQLRQVFVIGPAEQTSPASRSLREAGIGAPATTPHVNEHVAGLELTEFSPDAVPNTQLHAADGVGMDGRFAAVLGVASLAQIDTNHFGPNLLDAIELNNSSSWLEHLRRHWSIAVAVLLAVVLYTMSCWEQSRVDQLTLAREQDPIEKQLVKTRLEIGRLKGFELRYAALSRKCEQGNLAAFTEHVAHCLPRTVWLTSIEMHVDGTVAFRGKTQNEPDVYRSLDALRRGPTITSLSLNSTSTPDHYGLVNFELRGSRRLPDEVNSESN